MRLKPISIFATIFLSLILFCQSVYAGLSRTQVSQIAKEITVMIDGCQSGSGAIFQREGNIYSVLTVKHAVSSEDSSCLIIDADGDRYQVDNSNVERFKDLDLAVVKFSSAKNYKVGTLGDSSKATEGQSVYIAGYPAPTALVPTRSIAISSGSIVSLSKQPSDGYALIYDNSTQPGMSGGAVLDEDGKIIGIHGQGGEKASGKSGLNLGIPIHFYIASQAAKPKPVPLAPPPKPIQPKAVPSAPVATPKVSQTNNPVQTLNSSQRSQALARSKEPWCVGWGAMLIGFGAVLLPFAFVGVLGTKSIPARYAIKFSLTLSIAILGYYALVALVSSLWSLLWLSVGMTLSFAFSALIIKKRGFALLSFGISIWLAHKGIYACGRESLILWQPSFFIGICIFIIAFVLILFLLSILMISLEIEIINFFEMAAFIIRIMSENILLSLAIRNREIKTIEKCKEYVQKLSKYMNSQDELINRLNSQNISKNLFASLFRHINLVLIRYSLTILKIFHQQYSNEWKKFEQEAMQKNIPSKISAQTSSSFFDNSLSANANSLAFADKKEIERAYRRLARKYHPDINKDKGATKRFKEINHAYEILCKPELSLVPPNNDEINYAYKVLSEP